MTVVAVEASLRALARCRPVFHSEADFQHALAWQLQLDHPDAKIRLETRPLAAKSVFLDLLLDIDGVRTAVELKYLVRSLAADIDGERFELRAQSAHDVRRYDIVKDIARLEAVLAAGAAETGVMIAVTNDPAYWTVGRTGTIDAAFRLHEGATLTGDVAWATHAGAGTTAKRTQILTLRGRYQLRWKDYSDTGGRSGKFRALVVEVPPANESISGASEPASTRIASAPNDIRRFSVTCRQEILDAIVALERRHSRDTFSSAEIVAEVLASGSAHQASTIGTHVNSAMCVNAPANHPVRYPDLERVGRGLYRRVRR